MENNYQDWNLIALKNREIQLMGVIQASQNLCSQKGGWMFWDGDKEQRAKMDLDDVRAYIKLKQKQEIY
jgi:hypothetical protein